MESMIDLAIYFRFSRRFFLLLFWICNVLPLQSQTFFNGATSDVQQQGGIRIMPLGNSITFGNDAILEDSGLMKSYRQELWLLLTGEGYVVDFVGSESSGQDVTPSFDVNNAGFSGILKGELLTLIKTGINPRDGKKLTDGPYLDAYRPNIILLHIGTNSPTPSVEEIDQLLDEVDAYESRTGISATVIVARIIKRLPKDEGDINVQKLAEYNENLAALIEERKVSDRLVGVDMENGAGIVYKIGVDMSDLLHPSESGYKKMANVWFEALVPLLGVPLPAPSGLTAEAVSESAIALHWTDNSEGEETVVLERSASPDSGFTVLENLPSNAVSFTDQGLDPGQTAYYRLKAVNSHLESKYSNTASATTINHSLAAPSELKANAVSAVSIEVHWTDNTDSESGFILESAAAADGEFTELSKLGADTAHYLHEGLAPQTTVFYRVKATNEKTASAYSEVVSATTLVTGIAENKFSKSLKIYPNPADALLHLEVDNEKTGTLHIRIISVTGSELADFSIEKTGTELKTRFNIDEIRQGMYIMEITFEDFRTTRLLSVQ